MSFTDRLVASYVASEKASRAVRAATAAINGDEASFDAAVTAALGALVALDEATRAAE